MGQKSESSATAAAGTKSGSGAVKLVLWAIFATAAAGAAGYFGWQWRSQRDASQTKAAKATEDLGYCQTQVAELEPKVAAGTKCAAALNAAGEKSAGLKQDLQATKAELEVLARQRKQAVKREQAFTKLRKKLEDMVSTGKLNVTRRSGRTIVRLPNKVLFPSGSAKLSERGEIAIHQLGFILGQFPDRQFMVVGHTDKAPTTGTDFRNNWELSTARAVNVTSHLVKAGVVAKNLIAAGVGENDPVASNSSKTGRAKNRRIEVVLMFNEEELEPVLSAAEKLDD